MADRPIVGTSFRRCTSRVMGSEAQVVLPDTAGVEIAEESLLRLDWLDCHLNPYNSESEVARINEEAAGGWCTIPAWMAALLVELKRLSEWTEGAFDCTCGRLLRMWNMLHDGATAHHVVRQPTHADLDRAAALSGWRHVELDVVGGAVRFHSPGVELNLSAAAKGYAADWACRYLKAGGVPAAIVSLGSSSIAAFGLPAGEAGWRVGLPPNIAPADSIALCDEAMSVSGSAEQWLSVNGRRRSHIIDPANGRPARYGVTAIAICNSALTAEAMSTAAAVRGDAFAARLAASLPDSRLALQQRPGTRARWYGNWRPT
ncbi:MAG: FAD:protein FMN transferase [Armatimonadetes bacterium]|nr:FAD:protein FMN transferase [Armatimonadota bacterium]MDE2207800.1 FAD:protein FMN transferase [Armatimonadota bacterium]